jgi:esterase/lipase superfamily enzyme
MLFMVTNRRIRNGRYDDEERANFGYDYQFAYDGGPRRQDGFAKRGKKGFKTALLNELNRLRRAGTNTPKVGIYLHGYNNDYHDGIDEIVDLEKSLGKELGYNPVIVGFSWPSTGRTVNYLSDREEVRDSVGAFTRFLIDINDFVGENARDCFSTTYCIAHSMGNYLLRKGMEYLSDELGTPTGRLLFAETIMLAPDLASHDIDLDGKGQYIADFSRRVHVYYSKHDRALKASSAKRFGAGRLGRHGAADYSSLADNVVVVNAEKYANAAATAGLTDRSGAQVSVHSSQRYHPNILNDVVQVMASIDRDQISGRQPVEAGQDEVFLHNHYALK